jgi:hypothetical protein
MSESMALPFIQGSAPAGSSKDQPSYCGEHFYLHPVQGCTRTNRRSQKDKFRMPYVSLWDRTRPPGLLLGERAVLGDLQLWAC